MFGFSDALKAGELSRQSRAKLTFFLSILMELIFKLVELWIDAFTFPAVVDGSESGWGFWLHAFVASFFLPFF